MSVVALRYAHAFADVVQSRRLDAVAVERQLGDFNATLAGSDELREVLMNPSIPRTQKLKVLDEIARRLEMATEARNFLASAAGRAWRHAGGVSCGCR